MALTCGLAGYLATRGAAFGRSGSLPPRAFLMQDAIPETTIRFVQIEMLPAGKALIDIDKLTHAVPEGEGARLFLGAQHIDVPHSLYELENVLAGRERTDNGENSRAGFGVR
jgi:hypothetical protein